MRMGVFGGASVNTTYAMLQKLLVEVKGIPLWHYEKVKDEILPLTRIIVGEKPTIPYEYKNEYLEFIDPFNHEFKMSCEIVKNSISNLEIVLSSLVHLKNSLDEDQLGTEMSTAIWRDEEGLFKVLYDYSDTTFSSMSIRVSVGEFLDIYIRKYQRHLAVRKKQVILTDSNIADKYYFRKEDLAHVKYYFAASKEPDFYYNLGRVVSLLESGEEERAYLYLIHKIAFAETEGVNLSHWNQIVERTEYK